MKIGAQLYTIRNYTKSLEDFDIALKRIANIGYRYVQVSGTCEYEPEWLDAVLKKYGLKCVITHTSGNKMIENPKQTVIDHNILGCDYIGLGSMPDLFNLNISDRTVVDAFLKNYGNVMKVYKDHGKLLMYHNHQFEFIKLDNGQNMIEYLAERTAPDELGFTVDTYWVQYGGYNPAKIIASLSGRVPCVHFKDYLIVRQKENPVRMAQVGYGNLDWDEIISACEDAGTKYALIEQDNCYDEDPFECMKKSFDFLVSKGLDVE